MRNVFESHSNFKHTFNVETMAVSRTFVISSLVNKCLERITKTIDLLE
jgi:hypothetical protein